MSGISLPGFHLPWLLAWAAALTLPARAQDRPSGGGAIDSREIAADVRKLASFGTRSTCSTFPASAGRGISAARDWLRARFASVPGVRVVLDPFMAQGCPGRPKRDNVVAWVPGTRDASRIIVIGGHYDSTGGDPEDGDEPAPGANDSGSQTALLLQAARAFATEPAPVTVVLVAFAGEEQGLVGSAAFVSHLGALFPGGRVEAMLNCDIVGGDRDANGADDLRKVRVFASPRASAQGLFRAIERGLDRLAPGEASLLPAIVPVLAEDRPGRTGDHASFLDAGIPALRWIESRENLAHQHSARDLPEFVTPEYVARVARAVVAAARALAAEP